MRILITGVAGFIGSPAMNFVRGSLASEGGGLVFDEGNLRLPLAKDQQEGLKDHVGKEVTLGIRPEDIHDPDTMGRGVDTAVEIEAKVEVVEPMGNEVTLHLTTGKSSFVARVDPDHIPTVEQNVRLAVEIDKAHFFDLGTEESLVRRSQTLNPCRSIESRDRRGPRRRSAPGLPRGGCRTQF